MKTPTSFLLVVLTACTGQVSAKPLFYAAAAMTKAQQNSSIPTDAGIFIQTEDGEWIGFGPKIQQVNSASQDPSDPDAFFLSCGNGIVRSLDGGHSWKLVTGWEISDATAIVIDPTDSERVYASTGWGIWKSLDRGETWIPAMSGLTETFSKTLAIDELNPARILAGTAGGLVVSDDRAETWTRVTDVPPTHVLRLRRGTSDPKVWLAVTEGDGAWLSTDDARSWRPTAPAVAEANLYGAAVDPLDAGHLAVSGWGVGVRISTDGGQSWIDRSSGLPSPNIMSLTFDPEQPGRLWASAFEEGTVYSDDFGMTWIDAGLYGAYVLDSGFLDIDP